MRRLIKQVVLFCSVGAVLSLFFFRQALMAGALELVLHRVSQGEMAYESRRWEGDKLVYEGLFLGNSFYSTKAEFNCLFHRTPFYFEVHLTFTSPKLYVGSQQDAPLLTALVPSKFLVVKCDVDEGEIEFEGDISPLSFTFVSGAAKEEIGTLALYDREDSIFDSELLKVGDNIVTEWNITEAPVKRLLELSRFFYPIIEEGWSELSGVVDVQGKCDWDQNLALITTAANAHFQTLNMTNTILGIHVQSEECQVQLNYPVGNRDCPIWEQIVGSVVVSGGDFLVSEPLLQKPWGVADCNLTLSLDPHNNPHCELEGKIFHQGEAYPLNLHAKGAVHDDASFWMEGGFKALSTDLNFSFCSSSKGSYVVQTDVHEMDQPFLTMILEGVAFRFPAVQDLTVPNGKLQGCVTGWIENGELKRVQCNNLHIRDLYVECLESVSQVFLSDARLNGEVVKDPEWSVVDLSLDLTNGAIAHERWHSSELEASIEMTQNEFKNAFVKGVFMGVGGEVRLSGAWKEAQAVCHFAAPFTDWLQTSHKGEIDPLIHLYGMCKRGEDGFVVSGSFILRGGEIFRFERVKASGFDDHRRVNISNMDPSMIVEPRELSRSSEMKDFTAPQYNFEHESLQFKASLDRLGRICKGHFESSQLSSVNYIPLLRYFDADLQAEGVLSVSGEVSPTEIKAQFASNRFCLGSPKFCLEVPSIQEAELIYTFQGGDWRGKIPIKGGRLKEHLYGLTLEQLDAELLLKDHSIHIEKGAALCEDIRICAQADLSFKKDPQLQIITESIEGSVESLLRLSSFESTYFPLPSEGIFSSGKNGLHLFLQKKGEEVSVDWRVKAQFQEVSLRFSEQAALENVTFDLDFDSSVEVGALSRIKGDLLLKTTQYRFTSDFIHCKDKGCEFDVQLERGGSEILKVFGSGKKSGRENIEFSMIHQDNHFYSSSWDKLSFCLGATGITAFEFCPQLQGKNLYSQAVFLSEAGLLSLESSRLELLKKLEGEIQARVVLSQGGVNFEAESTNLSFGGTVIPKFDFKGRKSGEEWIFEKISAADLVLKGVYSQGVCPYWEARWKDVAVKGEAAVGENIFCRIKTVEGLLPYPYTIKGLSEFQLVFSPQISLYGIDFGLFQNEEQMGRVWTKVLAYNPESKKWEAEKVGFKGALLGDNQQIEGFLNVKWAPCFFSFQGVVEEGGFVLRDAVVKPSQIMGFYEAPYFHVKSQLMLGKAPLYVQAKVNPSKQFQGSIVVQDKGKKESVVFSMRDTSFCESIIGSLYGLEFQLQRSQLAAPFSGKVVVRDGNTAAQLFPDGFSLLKDVKNLEFVGSWIYQNNLKNWGGDQKAPHDFCSERATIAARQGASENKNSEVRPPHSKTNSSNRFGIEGLIFQGEVNGKNFEFKNYFFQEMHASVCFSPNHALLKNIVIADPAGTISIKLIECAKEKNWIVDAPLVKVQNFRPSLVRKAGVETNEVKPFLIRNLVLSDVHAEIDKGVSVFGKGSLNFTNAFKKEASLFEAPITMLKNLGLDLELFSPASGEVECLLKDKKIFLTGLKNTFSEGKRSQFYLAPDLEPSFIDLDGNLHINVRMKQDVVMKLIEPFALTIRGTWEKPSYGLR